MTEHNSLFHRHSANPILTARFKHCVGSRQHRLSPGLAGCKWPFRPITRSSEAARLACVVRCDWDSIQTVSPKKRRVNMRISCPNCGSLLIYRSRKKGILEHVLSKTIFVHPFRCEGCDSRFFRWSLHEKSIPPRPMPTS